MASAPNSVAIGAGSIASQPNTVSFGSPGNERRLTNVAPGINGTDAANMNQLWGVQSSVNEVARRAYSGVAAATALTMIPEVDPGKTIAVGVGAGTYQGYAATALGVSIRFSDAVKAKLGVGISGSSSTYGGGISYQW
ncbi:YadA-like family protein [Burkholderia sp. Ac-20345]|uniref:YadA family autotransporter adhesin n=1 Tax=Burkholderia sp. Ac-20345 TaxID=2703891 RepID=UPI003216714E